MFFLQHWSSEDQTMQHRISHQQLTFSLASHIKKLFHAETADAGDTIVVNQRKIDNNWVIHAIVT